MSQRRVGTWSMGILLVALGLILLASQFMGVSVLQYIFKWWPLILVMLGVEILLYSFRSKEEDPKVKFDIFSIFITAILVVASIGIYTATTFFSGVMDCTFIHKIPFHR